MPLGGGPGSGSGRLTGVVYLDTNENGKFDAGEAGAPNVTVILDGRFSTRTDTNGRFDFPAVAAGRHVLTVQADNLPLPWTLTDQGRTEVEVGTRDRVDVNIGAMRLKLARLKAVRSKTGVKRRGIPAFSRAASTRGSSSTRASSPTQPAASTR